MTGRPLAVYGSGGSGREIAWLGEICGYSVSCFIDDDPSKVGSRVNNIPVVSLADAVATYPSIPVALGIGISTARESVVARIERYRLQCVSIVHPRAELSRSVTFGQGVVIYPGCILTTNVVIGDYVQLNVGCTISHDSKLAAYATLAPGVHLSGFVTVGRRVHIGTGASVINGIPGQPLTIGDDAIVGAGACVTRAVDASVTVVGVPARPIQRHEPLASSGYASRPTHSR